MGGEAVSEPPRLGEPDPPPGTRLSDTPVPFGVAGDAQQGTSGPRVVRGEEIPVVELRQNVDQVVVRTTHDRLQAHLESFQRGLGRKYERRVRLTEAAAYVGVGVTLLVPLFTADFRKWGPLTPAVLEAGCGFLGGLMLLMAARKLTQAALAAIRRHEDHSGVTAAVKAIESDPEPPAST
jgi:hypothetical protein